ALPIYDVADAGGEVVGEVVVVQITHALTLRSRTWREARVGAVRHHEFMSDALDRFHPATASWFRGAFGAPTPAQEGAWGALAGGANTLVVAPTGSGKTLSAFLAALDRLLLGETAEAHATGPGTRVLYISPLKAL